MENIEKLSCDLNDLDIQMKTDLEALEKQMEQMKQRILEQNQQKRQAIETKLTESRVQQFAKKIVNQPNDTRVTYKRFIESQAINCLITAPTQVGKTDATKTFIKTCLEYNLPIVISCDNKTDQLEQFFTRISDELDALDIVLVKASESDKKFKTITEKCFMENKRIIIFCLDNYAQINKVKERFMVLNSSGANIQKVVLIHDEGDVVTKDADIINQNPDQSESHQEWLEMVNYFSTSNISLKRVFVTATPENVCYKYKVEHVIRLPVPSNYIGYDKIEYHAFEDPDEIRDILIEEQNRRVLEKENGVILYCVDKKISEGQDPTFKSVCSYLDKCVVNTYNGNGITARVLDNKAFKARLQEFVRLNNRDKSNHKIKFTNKSTNRTKNVWNIKGMAIKDFYQICKEIGMGIFVTIGMDLVARAISFVSSEHSSDAVAATTMIYKPGNTLHAVGLTQAIGRITGTARPDLKRRLYAHPDVIENYINYNLNQEQYLQEIAQTDGVVTSEIMKKIELNKRLTRPLDRTKLKLKPRYKSEQLEIFGEIDGVDLNKLNKWLTETTTVAKMIRYLYDQNREMTFNEFKSGIEYIGSNEEFLSHIKNGQGPKARHGKLWNYSNNIISINHKIKSYIDSKSQV